MKRGAREAARMMRKELRRRFEDPRYRRARKIDRLMDAAVESWVTDWMRERSETNPDWLVYMRGVILGLRPSGWRAFATGDCDVCATPADRTCTETLGLQCPHGHRVHFGCLAVLDEALTSRCPVCLRLEGG